MSHLFRVPDLSAMIGQSIDTAPFLVINNEPSDSFKDQWKDGCRQMGLLHYEYVQYVGCLPKSVGESTIVDRSFHYKVVPAHT